ncbi:hypothetical protein OROGR_010865 [Orobanche gracilis]
MDESLNIQLYYNGEFLKTKFSGGSHVLYNDTDPDLFSYSVLMEWVKDLETGKTDLEFYVDENVDKGIDAMKHMQPHVIVRPRPSPVKAIEKKLVKRKFVIIQGIQNEKHRRMSTRKKLNFNNALTRDKNEGTSLKAVTNDNSHNELENLCADSGGDRELMEFEQQKLKRMEENERQIAALGLHKLSTSLLENETGE